MAIDEGSSEILVSIFTEADGGDGEQLPEMLNSIEEPIAQVSGDGAYDSWDNHEAIAEREQRQRYHLEKGVASDNMETLQKRRCPGMKFSER